MSKHTSYATWSPPPGFAPVPSKIPGIEVYAPAPEQEEEAPARTFRCPQCNGAVHVTGGDEFQLVSVTLNDCEATSRTTQ